MKDRILEFLRKENKTSSQFAEEIGVQPSSVSHIVSGRNKPSLDFVIKMLQKYGDLSTDWLIFGKGDMYNSDINADLFADLEDNHIPDPATNLRADTNQQSDNELIIDNKEISAGSFSVPKSDIQRVILIYSDNSFTEYKPSL